MTVKDNSFFPKLLFYLEQKLNYKRSLYWIYDKLNLDSALYYLELTSNGVNNNLKSYSEFLISSIIEYNENISLLNIADSIQYNIDSLKLVVGDFLYKKIDQDSLATTYYRDVFENNSTGCLSFKYKRADPPLSFLLRLNQPSVSNQPPHLAQSKLVSS